jgi:hypothetical protein
VHRAFFPFGLLLVIFAACASDTEPPPDLRMRVEWLTGEPSAMLPDDLEKLRLVREIDGERSDFTVIYRTAEGELGQSFSMTEDGRIYLAVDILRDLPAGSPITLTVEGYRAGDQLAYVGRVGPIVLSAGQRYYADLAMYEIGVSAPTVLENTPSVFMHTATPLPDGRVLVAGGFDTVENGAACPAALPPMSRCFRLRATSDAWIFEATTGKFHSVGGGMLAARAGHTATALPGGRVLVAGGATEALFALVPFGSGSFAPYLSPEDEMGESTAHMSFEIFLPEANPEENDVDGDGDPGRGGFTGSGSDPTEPGFLNVARFGHAAAVTTSTDENRVVLVGGIGSEANATYEVYDDRKPGGPGVYDGGGMLGAARGTPGAIELSSGEVWIFGGGVATSDGELAEVWAPSPSDPNGAVESAADAGFPGTPNRPELSLLAPSVASIAGTHAVVVGWMGARCATGTSTPAFPATPDGAGTELCGPMGGAPRSFTLDGSTGAATGVTLNAPHAFAGMATLEDGSIAVTGGIANLQWSRQQSIEIFTGQLMGGAAQLSSVRYMLRTQRALHSTTALPGGGLMSVGGINLSTDADNLTLQAAGEVLYLPRGPLDI